MTTKQTEMSTKPETQGDLPERLRAAARSARTKSYPLSDLIPMLQSAADCLELVMRERDALGAALLAADEKVGGEAVAWMRNGVNQTHSPLHNFTMINPDSDNWTPLYTRHQQAAQVPLSEKQKQRALSEAGFYEHTWVGDLGDLHELIDAVQRIAKNQ